MRIPHPVARRRSPPCAWAAALALCVGSGCDRGAVPEGASPQPAALAPAPRAFELHGAPGPWWREGATDAAFAAESRACLAHSREARRRAAEDARADAAYRGFLDCMLRGGWRRGPRAPDAGLPAPGR